MGMGLCTVHRPTRLVAMGPGAHRERPARVVRR